MGLGGGSSSNHAVMIPLQVQSHLGPAECLKVSNGKKCGKVFICADYIFGICIEAGVREMQILQ